MNATHQDTTLESKLLALPTRRCFAKFASGLLALGLLFGAQVWAGVAQVTTDQPDYAPGSTAIITGSGFAPAETVTLQVLHADGTPSTGDDHLPWTVVADAFGAFATIWHVCEDDCVGSTLRLTAVGRISGQTAEAIFTDSVFLINMSAPIPVSGGCARLVPTPPPPSSPTSFEGFLQAGHTYQLSFVVTTSGVPPPCFLANPPSITFTMGPGFGNLTFTAVRVGATTTYTNRVTIPPGVCGSSPVTFTCDGGSTRQVTVSGLPLQLVASTDCINAIPCLQPPTITCPASVTANTDAGVCSAVVSYPAPAVTGTPAPTVTCTPASGSTFPKGITTVNCSAVNGVGSAACAFTVTVEDGSAPLIGLNGSSTLYVEACTPYVELGAYAIDDCEGVVPVTVSGTVDTSTPGTYLVSYQASDSGGRTVTKLRTVNVYDPPPGFTTAPANLVIACGPDNAAAIDAWLASAAATDSCGVVSITHVQSWFGGCGTDSAFVLWTATDTRGQTATTSAALTILPEGSLTGAKFGVPSLQLTLPANTVRPSAITLLNTGSCPIVVQSAQIAAGFESPGLSVLTALPMLICAGSSSSITIRIDTSGALEGVYAATLTLHGPDGGSLALPIEIAISGRLVPDLTANYTDSGVRFLPAASPVFPVTGEAFTIHAAVKNIGTAPSGAFSVKFFEGANLLGTTQMAGLDVGQSIQAAFEMPTGIPVDGFYLIRAEVVPPAGGELRIDNNSASGLLQVGMPFVGTAFISVTASFAPDCAGSSATLSIHAEYVLVTDQATLTFPVQGGRVDALIQGTAIVIDGAHTDVAGNSLGSISLPVAGSYTLQVTVTDFTVTGIGNFPVTVPSGAGCSQGGAIGVSGDPPPYSPPGELVDLYVCSSDISFRTGDGITPLFAPPQVGQGVQICAAVHYFTSAGRELNSQPVHLTARRQTSDSVEEYFIGTALANFAGGGSTTICVPWTIPDEGTFVVSVSLAPTVTQFQANDLATRALLTASPPPPASAIHVTAEGGSGCFLGWVGGRATYERPDSPALPVVCGQITVRAYDNTGTLLATVIGPIGTDLAGNYGFGPAIGLPEGTNRIVVEVTDGTLTGSTEFNMVCVPPNVPAPDAPPALGDLYLFSEHIAFLAPDCLSSWNRNPLPGENISVAANIHYFDNYSGFPLADVPVDVNVLIPIGDALQSFNIAHTTVAFPFGGGSSVICVPWTPTVIGPQIVQVVINPDALPLIPFEYLGNNAATRLIFVGLQDVVLTVDPRERRIRPGQSADYSLQGEVLNGTHPTMNLTAYFEGPGTLPAGLTTLIGNSSLTLPDDTTLTLATTTATPPGTYRFYVVGSGDQRSSIARLTLIVEPPDMPPLEIACPADIVTVTDPAQCAAVVSFTALASGGCSVTTVVCLPPSGSTFPVGVTSVACSATDTCGVAASCQFTVTVNNPPPTVSITGPASGAIIPVGTTVAFSGTYADNAGDTHSGGFMADALALPTTLNGGNATATHSFTTPGVYTIQLTVTDACGQSASTTSIGDEPAMIVVFDPNGGFVTGGGWINSPAGAYTADPSLTGKANFGFVSKYKKSATVPAGETEFQFQAGKLNFHSTVYEWLVVSGARAQYKGTGTINGAGNYRFLLTLTDGQITGGGGVDKFRIKITDGDAVVYDNVLGAADEINSANPQAISGGSIVIHK